MRQGIRTKRDMRRGAAVEWTVMVEGRVELGRGGLVAI